MLFLLHINLGVELMQRFFKRFLFTVALLSMVGSMANAGLIGHWPIEEGSGDTTADISGSGTTGVITNVDTGGLGAGGSAWVSDPVRGNVLGFDGSATGAFVRAGSIPAMDLTTDFTWAFWANQDPANNQPNNIIIGNRRDENAVDFTPRQFIKFTPTQFEWHTNGNGNDNLDYPDLADTAGEWHHHAVVKSGDSLTYYLDGLSTSTGLITQELPDAQPLFFGGDNSGTDGENWMGLLDEVRIYDNALSAAEVASIVPEPTSSLLVLLGVGMLLLGRRNRK